MDQPNDAVNPPATSSVARSLKEEIVELDPPAGALFAASIEQEYKPLLCRRKPLPPAVAGGRKGLTGGDLSVVSCIPTSVKDRAAGDSVSRSARRST